MTKTSKTLIFFGNERLSTGFAPTGAPTLQALIDNGYTIKAVVSHFTVGTSRKARTLEVQEIAEKHKIPVLLPGKLTDIKDQLQDFHADAAILVAYGKIVPQDIIDLFPKGIINIHPSLLPQYRGSTPIETAILDGMKVTGVSLMKLVKAMDAGPVWAQTEVTIQENESKQHLTQKLLTAGKDLLIRNLPAILDGSLQPQSQDESATTYTRLLSKSDSILNPAEKSAPQLEREIRAFTTWPKSKLTVGTHTITVLVAQPVKQPREHALVVSCAGNTWLEIQELIAPNGKKMSGEAFRRGYRY